MAKKTLLDDVLGRIVHRKPGFRTWFDRLPPEAQEELLVVKAGFNPDIHKKRTFALAIIESSRERGWETAEVQGVISWLARKP